MIRVPEEQLEVISDLNLLDGHPFTGVAFEESKSGGLLSEIEYVDGLPSGLARIWHPSGAIKEEYECKNGLKDGRSRSWYENGNIRSDAVFELGVELSCKEWDKSGAIIDERTISSANRKILEIQRNLRAQPPL